MKASVVIANYNNAKFIEDCINSLNSQTYSNIEIISGLTAGDIIVAEGLKKVRPRGKIKPINK